MSHEPPPRAGRPRSDAAARLAALLSEFEAPRPSEGDRPASPPNGPVDPEAAGLAPVAPVGEAPTVTQAVPPAPSPPRVDRPGSGQGGAKKRSPARRQASAAKRAPAKRSRSRADTAKAPAPTESPTAPVDAAPEKGKAAADAAPGPAEPAVAAEPAEARRAPERRPSQVGPEPASDVAMASPEADVAAVPQPAAAAATAAEPTELEPAPVDEKAAPEAMPVGRPSWLRRLRDLRWRSIAFAVLLVGLISAIPALAFTGARTLYRSRDGRVIEPITDPQAPGYQAIVDPTPTALVVQRDDELDPISLTVIGLGSGDTGGSVLFVPLDTTLVAPADGFFDSLRDAYEEGGNPILVNETARILGFGFDRVINLDDRGWATVVAQVAPVTVDNPDPVDEFSAGRIDLDPRDVGPYLAATTNDESDLNRLVRHEAFWDAWLQAIARAGSSDPSDPVVDEAGILPYVGTLAGGTYRLETLAVTPSEESSSEDTQALDPVEEELSDQVTEAVPFPVSPIRGARFRVRLLNGVSGAPIPNDVIERLVAGGAQLSAIGNADAFGRETTSITYFEPGLEEDAEAADLLLGGSSEVRSSRRTNESVDLVIILGSDMLDGTRGGGAAGGTTGGAGGR